MNHSKTVQVRQRNIWRRGISLLLMLIMLISTVGIVSPAAADVEWASVYESFITKRVYGDDIVSLRLADLTMDAIPELQMISKNGTARTYTIASDGVFLLGTTDAQQTLTLYKVKKTGAYQFISGGQSGDDVIKSVRAFSAQRDTERFLITGAKNNTKRAYYADGKKVSKAVYNSKYKAYFSKLKAVSVYESYALDQNPSAAFQKAVAAYAQKTVSNRVPLSTAMFATSVSMPKKITLYTGEDLAVTPLIQPETAAAGAKWTSSKPGVADVSDTGVVTAFKPGTTIITCQTLSGKTAKCTVTVLAQIAQGILIEQDFSALSVGHSRELTAVITPETTYNQDIAWSSSDKKIATVDANGIVNAVSSGQVTIMATAKDASRIKATVVLDIVYNDNIAGAIQPVQDFDQFVDSLSNLIGREDTALTIADVSDPYATRRLIAQSDGRIINYNAVGAQEVIVSDDGMAVLQFKTAEQAKRALKTIQEMKGIEYVEPDFLVQSEPMQTGGVKPRATANSWGVEAIEADLYSQYVSTKSNKSIVVAVVDSGVGYHSMINGRIAKGGKNFVDGKWYPDARYDDHGHGTHVAGTIIDCTPYNDVRIMPIRVLKYDPQSGGAYGANSAIASGIRHAAKKKAKVINLSLGRKGHAKVYDSAITFAVKKGATVVVAAGNSAENTSAYCPAHISKAIVVSAIDNHYELADFSNYGAAVDVAAPGVSIKSCLPNGEFGWWDGTSMAAPHVSAAAAMIQLANPKFKPAKIESTIKNACYDLGTPGKDMDYGFGIPKLTKLMPNQIQPTAITLNKTSLPLGVGKSETLTATVSPSTATNKTVTWSSSNAGIATVSNAGAVTGIKAGTTTITAQTVNGLKATCSVTVSAQAATGLSVTVTPSMTAVSIQESFSFNIQAQGGTGNLTYTYRLLNSYNSVLTTGSGTISGSGATVSFTRNAPETVRLEVTVRDSAGATETQTSATVTVSTLALKASVKPSKSTVNKYEDILWTMNITGGTGKYTVYAAVYTEDGICGELTREYSNPNPQDTFVREFTYWHEYSDTIYFYAEISDGSGQTIEIFSTPVTVR